MGKFYTLSYSSIKKWKTNYLILIFICVVCMHVFGVYNEVCTIYLSHKVDKKKFSYYRGRTYVTETKGRESERTCSRDLLSTDI